MNRPRKDSVQISSDQLDGRLAKIEDDQRAILSILTHANKDQIEELVRDGIGGSAQRKQILRLCETPKSIAELVVALSLNSGQALNNHLRPLKEHSLLQHATTQPEVTYEWSSLISKLPKAVREKLLK